MEKNSQKYREKRRMLANIINNSPTDSANESDNDHGSCASRRKLGRKAVKKDRSKAYRAIKKQKSQISSMQQKIDVYKRQMYYQLFS